MMIHYGQAPNYIKFKINRVEKYHRKIDAIISNINDSSLKPKDARKLKNQLIVKLQKK